MNTKLKIAATGFAALLSLMMASCAKKLVEHPYTTFTPSFFQTQAGLQSAINTLYAGMRFNFGPEPSLAITVMGTDEFTGGDQVLASTGGSYVRSFALYGGSTPIQSSDGSLLNVWNNNFNLINLANAVVGYAPLVAGLDSGTMRNLVAQARFLRGLYYLFLVEQFGAVPTDLGSGDLVFNQTAFQGFNRLPVTSVLTKDYNTMIADFTYATQNLPAQRPANAFMLSQGAAYLMLSRTYMFRGYSTLAQSIDFQNALTAATQVINNQSEYGVALQKDFGTVNAQGNDYNSEVMYSVERLPNDLNDNETPVSTNTSGAGNNASIDFSPNYTDITGAASPGVGREAIWGRPYRRFCPTAWLLNTAYADKFNDSRFDNTFQMMWWTVTGGNGGKINYGDTAFVLAKDQAQYDTLNGRGYAVVLPSMFWTAQNNNPQDIYPYIKKFSDSLKANYNDVVSGRPYQVAKLSELYLLAAEAAMQTGDNTTAANMINVLRTRAAYRPGISAADLANRVTAMQITPSQVTLDFILDERSREFCGESMRWPDLAMRGKLISRVQADNPDAGPNIQAFDVLRPIPQSELNAIIVSGAVSAYQNPGY